MKIEAVIKNLPNKMSSWPDSFITEFYHTFKEELTQNLFNLLYKTETDGTLSNSFSEATVTLILKPHKVSTNIVTD